jgi:DNA repair protein RadD
VLSCHCGLPKFKRSGVHESGATSPPPKYIPFVDADLDLVTRNGRAEQYFVEAERDEWHRMLTSIAEQRGYKPGWVAHKYKEKFGCWPARRYVKPMPPSAEVQSWVRSRAIAYAKARSAA